MNERTVLLGQKDKQMAEIMTKLLMGFGYKVVVAQDSSSIFKMVSRCFPDLIILDFQLEGMDGIKICKRLRNDFISAHIPIILLIEKKQLRKQLLEIERGVDDYLVKPPDPIDLEVRIEMALRRTEHQFHANSLTRLPGNRAIEKAIITRYEKRRPFSFAYVDIDNFKSFNDRYSYMLGDMVILQLAHITSQALKKYGNSDDYLGHIGGDDFIFLSTPDKVEAISAEILRKFDRLIPFHYNPEDRERGYIRIRDRLGRMKNIPLMSISIAIVNNRPKDKRPGCMASLIETAFEIKRYLKELKGSNYLVDRRCEDRGPERRRRDRGLKQKSVEVTSISVYKRRIQYKCEPQPLGQRLLDAGMITQQQLQEALRRHWLAGQPIGQTLVDMNILTADQIEEVLSGNGWEEKVTRLGQTQSFTGKGKERIN